MMAKRRQSGLCRICGSDRIEIFLRYDHAPAQVEQLLDERDLAADQPIELTVWKCGDCEFVQLLDSPLLANYYRSYDKSASHSPQAQGYQLALAAELADRFDLRGKRVLEAGCGDGFFAEALQERGAEVRGVDPGRGSAAATRARGVAVTEAYLASDNPFEPESMDAIIARQVISHVFDLESFMVAVVRFLKPGGRVFIEAPNVDTAIADQRYFDFFPDYANYFAPHSLIGLFRRYGFALEEVTPRAAGEHFLAVFRKHPEPAMKEAVESLVQSVRNLVEGEKRQGHRVACWGAGGRGITLIALTGLGPTDIEFVIDASAEKQGLYTPGSHLPIVAPDVLKDQLVDCLIITALAYKDEILEQLQHSYEYSGRVVVLTPDPQTVKVMDRP